MALLNFDKIFCLSMEMEDVVRVLVLYFSFFSSFCLRATLFYPLTYFADDLLMFVESKNENKSVRMKARGGEYQKKKKWNVTREEMAGIPAQPPTASVYVQRIS